MKVENNLPLVSVIIPYYNSRFDYFKEAIESVLSQFYNNWEAVVVNDGSNEQSKRFIEEYIEGLNDGRLSIIHLDKNGGPAFAKNAGIKASKGEIVTFLDADDIHLPWYYEEVVKNFSSKQDCNVLIADSIFLRELWNIQKKIYLTKSYSDLFDVSSNAHEIIQKVISVKETMLGRPSFKREVFKECTFDSSNFFDGDLDLILQVLNSDKFKLGTISSPGYLYRIYPSTGRVTHRAGLLFQDTKQVIKKYKSNPESVAYKYIEHRLRNSDHWKFASLASDLPKSGSISDYLKYSFLNFKSAKDRIQSMKFLMRMILNYKIMVPIFGIPLGYIRSYISVKDNKYEELKNVFLDHLKSAKDEKSKFYLDRTFKRLFNSNGVASNSNG